MAKTGSDGQTTWQKAYSIDKSVSKGTERLEWDKEFWQEPSKSKSFCSKALKTVKSKASRLKTIFE